MIGQLARVLQYALKIQNGSPAPELISSVCEAVFNCRFNATVSRQLSEATLVLPDDETLVLLWGVDGKQSPKKFFERPKKGKSILRTSPREWVSKNDFRAFVVDCGSGGCADGVWKS